MSIATPNTTAARKPQGKRPLINPTASARRLVQLRPPSAAELTLGRPPLSALAKALELGADALLGPNARTPRPGVRWSAHANPMRPIVHPFTAIYRAKKGGSPGILKLRPRRPRPAVAEESTQLALHALLRPRSPRARPQVGNPQAQLLRPSLEAPQAPDRVAERLVPSSLELEPHRPLRATLEKRLKLTPDTIFGPARRIPWPVLDEPNPNTTGPQSSAATMRDRGAQPALTASLELPVGRPHIRARQKPHQLALDALLTPQLVHHVDDAARSRRDSLRLRQMRLLREGVPSRTAAGRLMVSRSDPDLLGVPAMPSNDSMRS